MFAFSFGYMCDYIMLLTFPENTAHSELVLQAAEWLEQSHRLSSLGFKETLKDQCRCFGLCSSLLNFCSIPLEIQTK